MEDDLLCGFDFSDEEESSTQKTRQAKLNQTEEAFQAEKRAWHPICQIQHVCMMIPSRISASEKIIELYKKAKRRQKFTTSLTTPPSSKEEALDIKAAAEERYYSRDYERSYALARRALLVCDMMQGTDKKDLLALQERCKERLRK